MNYQEILNLINQSKTLEELGNSITKLSGIEPFQDWEFSHWNKNGECRNNKANQELLLNEELPQEILREFKLDYF